MSPLKDHKWILMKSKKKFNFQKCDIYHEIGKFVSRIVAMVALFICSIPQKNAMKDTMIEFCSLIFMQMNKRNTSTCVVE